MKLLPFIHDMAVLLLVLANIVQFVKLNISLFFGLFFAALSFVPLLLQVNTYVF